MHAELVVRGGTEDGARFLIHPGERLVVGRSSKSDIRLDHTRISRRHASLTLKHDGLHATDLGSRNGTRVAGRKLEAEEHVLVPPGRSVRLGPYKIETSLIDYDDARQAQTRQWRVSDARATPAGYQLTGLLGEGGQSRVWAARRDEDGEQVAIKILRSQADEEDRLRFLREGRLVKRVTSPFVVHAYEAGVSDRRPYLVMELVQGTSVNSYLRKGPLRLTTAVQLCEDLARALEAAHECGVIHRDVKPGNVLVTSEGRAKLSDFGMAKISQEQALTQTGVGMGSLPYVPPEQALQARDADERSDLYGLGTTIFHLVAGKPPFAPPLNDTPDEIRIVLEAIVHESPPDLTTLRPECPEGLEALVRRLLAKEPSDRPATAKEVAEELGRIRRRLQITGESRSSETHTDLRPLL